jgi:hypothetical protein
MIKLLINDKLAITNFMVAMSELNYLDCWVGRGGEMTHQKPMEFFKLGILVVIVISQANVTPSLNFRI